MAATGALLRNRLVGRRELALRVVGTSVEGIAFPGTLLHQIAVCAERAFYPNEILLHVLALRISAARREFPVTPVADHHVPAALGARLVERNIRHLLSLIQAPSSLAVRISRARHELPETATL